MNVSEGFRINLRENTATMYDSPISNILKPSNVYSYLSYNKMDRLRRTPMPAMNITEDPYRDGNFSKGAGTKLC